MKTRLVEQAMADRDEHRSCARERDFLLGSLDDLEAEYAPAISMTPTTNH